MNTILLIAERSGAAGHRLLDSVKSAVEVNQEGVFGSAMELYEGFKRLRGRVDVAILMADSRRQLLEILSLNDLLENVRIILVLPDHVRDTVSKGLQLRPRFVEYMDSNFGDVAAVLNKMKTSTDWR
jgi:hypothetical protein